jgi:hypothetical protein
MKRSSRPTLISGVATILLLCLVNAGTCRQVTPISESTPPAASAAQPPSSYGRPVTCTPPSYPPQQFLYNGCLPNGQANCFKNGYCQGWPAIVMAAQIGYGKIGLNFNMQPPLVINGFTSTDLNVTFKNVVVPIGSLQARAEGSSGLFIALRLQANAPKDMAVDTPEGPLGGGPDFHLSTLTLTWDNPRKWDGDNLQWWMLETNIGCRVSPGLSALVGLRRDKLSFALTDPRNAAGQPLNLDFSIPAAAYSLNRTMYADFSSEFWIPYLGVEIGGPRYRASLLWGPYAWTDMSLPYRYLVAPNNPLAIRINFDYECKDVKTANLLECNFEYDFDVSPRVVCRLWATGNWMQLKWRGQFRGSTVLEGIPDEIPVPGTTETIHVTKFFPSHTDVDTADYNRSMISGGIGGVLSF